MEVSWNVVVLVQQVAFVVVSNKELTKKFTFIKF
jgi:hypothetical protein